MIRLRSLRLANFKNVENGLVLLSNISSLEEMGRGAEATGIYGQNGSGKTSLIQALSLLKALMSGEQLPAHASDYVAAGQEHLEIAVEFLALLGDDQELEDYVLGIRDESPVHQSLICSYRARMGDLGDGVLRVTAEALSCKDLDSGESMHEVFAWEAANDESGGTHEGAGPFGLLPAVSDLVRSASSHRHFEAGELMPSTHWHRILASFKDIAPKAEAARIQAFQQGASPLFSAMLMAQYASIFSNQDRRFSKAATQSLTRVALPTVSISTACRIFATKNMAVLPTSHQGVVPLGWLPLASHEGNRGDYVDNFMLLDIFSDKPLPTQRVDELERAIGNISEVLTEIVPGLGAKVRRLGTIAGSDGKTLQRFELVSVRDGTSVPLRNESEGIQKILSILSLLVDVHVSPSTLVAIDELDSGVFEYLLGEILEAISEHGCGQLVFTAHNLRPLEVLPSTRIWFTTVDARNRYVRAPGIHQSNNLRRMYLKDIRLGGAHDKIYRPTSTLRIDDALYDAGMAMREMRTGARG